MSEYIAWKGGPHIAIGENNWIVRPTDVLEMVMVLSIPKCAVIPKGFFFPLPLEE